jgi:hypothetical protein
MHCNRIGLSLDEEREMMQFAFAAIEGECLRTAAAANAPAETRR